MRKYAFICREYGIEQWTVCLQSAAQDRTVSSCFLCVVVINYKYGILAFIVALYVRNQYNNIRMIQVDIIAAIMRVSRFLRVFIRLIKLLIPGMRPRQNKKRIRR